MKALPKKIAVLMGGPGSERDVSMATGKGVAKALRSLGVEVSEVDVKDADFVLPDGIELAFIALHGLNEKRPTKQGTLQVIKQVALQLGNTPAVCRKCYIHPSVLDRYLDGALQLNQTIMRKDEAIDKNEAVGMWAVERQLIRFLNAERHAANFRPSLEASLKASVRAARTKGLRFARRSMN